MALHGIQDIINIDGVREIEQGGKTFRFFSQSDFFLRVCARHSIKSIAEVRGGTPGKIEEMVTAFTDHSISILCFRLNIFGKGDQSKAYHDTPMALVLVEWSSGSGTKLLHVHLHFKGFSNPLTLIRLNNFDVCSSRPPDKRVLKEEKKDTNEPVYSGVDLAIITQVITEFVSNTLNVGPSVWCTEKSRWTMSTALPNDLIHSRSSILEEFMP